MIPATKDRRLVRPALVVLTAMDHFRSAVVDNAPVE